MVYPTHSTADQPQSSPEGWLDRESAEHPLSEVSSEAGSVPFGNLLGVGCFSNLSDAEYAVTDLRSVGFPLKQIMVVAHSFRRQDQFTGVELCDRFEASQMGITPEQVRLYQERLGCGEYMMIVRGTENDLNRAASLLQYRGIQEWQVCEPTAVNGELPPVTSTPVTSTPVTAADGAKRVTMPYKRSIGVFSLRHDVEAALTELREAGFPMDRVSLIAKQTRDNDRIAGVTIRSQIGDKSHEGDKPGAMAGGRLGGLASLLIGLGVLAIPRMGSGRIRGATATTLMTMVAGMAVKAAAAGLTAGLVGLGIPENRARIYNDRVTNGDYLIRIDGTEAEIRQAETILHRHNIQEWGIYSDAVAVAVNADVNTTINPVDTTINPAINADVNPIVADDVNPEINVTRSPQLTGEQPLEAIERQPVLDREPDHQNREPRIEHPLPNVTIIDRRDETRRYS